MAGVFLTLMVLGYLVFLIDWKELRSISAQGGWATICFFAILAAILVSVVVSPGTAPVNFN